MTSSAPAIQQTQYLAEDESYKVVVATAVGFGISVFAIVGRLISRFLTRKSLEWNDFFILLAFIPKLALDTCSILLVQYGIGRHLQTLSPSNMRKYLQVLYVGSFLYPATIALIKLSILSLFWVAFPSKWVHTVTFFLITIVLLWGTACWLVGILVCIPIHKSWDPTIPGHCINLQHFYYGLQIPNIVTDFAILFLPFYPIWKLHLPTEKKVLMSGVMCIGLLTCIFDIIRLVVLLRLSNGGDITWNQTSTSVWTDLEPSVAILVACLPIMRPLLHPVSFWRLRKSHALQPAAPDSDPANPRDYYQMKSDATRTSHSNRQSYTPSSARGGGSSQGPGVRSAGHA